MLDLKLKDLRYLVAVADSGHFGRAAAQCFVTQPTLSAQLRKLEESLGVQLVERRPRAALLTEIGAEVAQRARIMLADASAIEAIARARHDPLAGPLRVALLPTVGPYLLPLIALKLRKALPRLELMLYEYQTSVLLEHLHRGDIDVGILALPLVDEDLDTRALYDEPFLLAVPKEHALARRGQVRLADLRDETVLLLEDGHCLRDQALSLCNRAGGHEKQDFRATSLETLRQMVVAGIGITLMPALAGRGAYRHTRGLALRPFVRPAPTRQIGAVWRKSSARLPAIQALCEPIRSVALPTSLS